MTENCKKALLIINPTAGKKTVHGNLYTIVKVLCDSDIIPTVAVTRAKGDATEYVAEKNEEYDLVICCGGDGTLNETITGMMRSTKQVPIGYIPCGTTNDMANTLKLSKQPKRAAEIIAGGNALEHDIGMFGEDMYFTYIASFGAFTKASYATPQSAKNLLGHFAYVLEGAKELGEIKSYRTKFTFDDMTIEDDFIFASISNTTSFGGVMNFPRDKVALNDGKFEFLLIRKPQNPLEISSILLNLSKGDFKSDKNIMLFHTDNIKVEPESSLVWTVDGECSGEVGDIVINNIPDTIKIIQP